MYVFVMPGSYLGILTRREKAASLEEALNAATVEMRGNLAVFEKNGYDPGYQNFNFGQSISRNWACDDNPQCYVHPIEVPLVTREKENWKIVLRNKWDYEATLDSKFAPLSVRTISPASGER